MMKEKVSSISRHWNSQSRNEIINFWIKIQKTINTCKVSEAASADGRPFTSDVWISPFSSGSSLEKYDVQMTWNLFEVRKFQKWFFKKKLSTKQFCYKKICVRATHQMFRSKILEPHRLDHFTQNLRSMRYLFKTKFSEVLHPKSGPLLLLQKTKELLVPYFFSTTFFISLNIPLLIWNNLHFDVSF